MLSVLKRIFRDKEVLVITFLNYVVLAFSFLRNILVKESVSSEFYVYHIVFLNLFSYIRYSNFGLFSRGIFDENLDSVSFKRAFVTSTLVHSLFYVFIVVAYLRTVYGVEFNGLIISTGLFALNQHVFSGLVVYSKRFLSFSKASFITLFLMINQVFLTFGLFGFWKLYFLLSSVYLCYLFLNNIVYFKLVYIYKIFLGLNFIRVSFVSQLIFSVMLMTIESKFNSDLAGNLLFCLTILSMSSLLVNAQNEARVLKKNIHFTNLLKVIFNNLIIVFLTSAIGFYLAWKLDLVDFNSFSFIVIASFILFATAWIAKNPIFDLIMFERKNLAYIDIPLYVGYLLFLIFKPSLFLLSSSIFLFILIFYILLYGKNYRFSSF